MPKRVQDCAPRQDKTLRGWIRENLAEQEVRYGRIVAAMDELAPERDRWIEAFLMRIQTRGFNQDGDSRRPIARKDLPKKPRRRSRVVF